MNIEEILQLVHAIHDAESNLIIRLVDEGVMSEANYNLAEDFHSRKCYAQTESLREALLMVKARREN